MALPFQSRAETKELEVMCFQGGYGIDLFTSCALAYEKLHPDVKITLKGSPRIWEQLQPRFATGDVPDLVWPGWGMKTIWNVVREKQLTPLDKYLDQPAFNSDKKWRDTFVPSLLKKGTFQGKQYLLPFNADCFGLWYNKKMFDKHGWTAPKTYSELLALCEKIKAADIAPITYTGRYSFYLVEGIYLPLVISDGGLKVFNDAQSMKPGAWKHPSFLRAAKSIMELQRKGYFQVGCIGMSHIESQRNFLWNARP
jgi:N-acetylglucosamine transport system substrate-binding protein